MAMRFLMKSPAAIFAQFYTSAASSCGILSRPSFVPRLRPLAAAADACAFHPRLFSPAICTRGFSTQQTASSLNHQDPNWSNGVPDDGCDFEHWFVLVKPPPENTTRDELIDSYIKTLAKVFVSEKEASEKSSEEEEARKRIEKEAREEARMRIYSVSTVHYFAFGACVSEQKSHEIKRLGNVLCVVPDSYVDVENKDYGGEPFINGQAMPYDRKYYKEWFKNCDKTMQPKNGSNSGPPGGQNLNSYGQPHRQGPNYGDYGNSPQNVPGRD